MAIYIKTGSDHLSHRQASGHALIVVMVFLMLSSLLLLSSLEILKQDSLSTFDFERTVLPQPSKPLVYMLQSVSRIQCQ